VNLPKGGRTFSGIPASNFIKKRVWGLAHREKKIATGPIQQGREEKSIGRGRRTAFMKKMTSVEKRLGRAQRGDPGGGSKCKKKDRTGFFKIGRERESKGPVLRRETVFRKMNNRQALSLPQQEGRKSVEKKFWGKRGKRAGRGTDGD